MHAHQALDLDPDHCKSLYRRGTILADHKKMLPEAFRDLDRVSRIPGASHDVCRMSIDTLPSLAPLLHVDKLMYIDLSQANELAGGKDAKIVKTLQVQQLFVWPIWPTAHRATFPAFRSRSASLPRLGARRSACLAVSSCCLPVT